MPTKWTEEGGRRYCYECSEKRKRAKLSPTKTSAAAYRKLHARLQPMALAFLNHPPESADMAAGLISLLREVWEDGCEHGLAAPLDPPATTEALPESDGFDPEHCPTCKAFENRNRPPAPPVEVKSELWDSAMLKMRQLQAEIQACSATPAQKSNMLHSHSKLCMFATDAWEKHVLRPAQRAPRPAAPSKGDGHG